MTREIACGDVVEGCSFKASGSSEDELLKQVSVHAAEKHGVTELTPELAAQVKAAIRSR
jgi:predicted small metal-binding protein